MNDTSSSYSVNVESGQKFSFCCGPGEWVVCNCITEGDGYVRLDQVVEDNLVSEDSDELTTPSDDA